MTIFYFVCLNLTTTKPNFKFTACCFSDGIYMCTPVFLISTSITAQVKAKDKRKNIYIICFLVPNFAKNTDKLS